MESVVVQFKGQAKELALPLGADTPWAQLQQLLEREFCVPRDAQRVFFNKKRVDLSDEDGDRALHELGFGATETSAAPPRILLMAGASKEVIDDMKKTKEEVEAEMRIRANRRVVSIGQRNEKLQAAQAVSTDYRFHAIEVLENFRDANRARSILEQLANDRGILAVMAKHKWSVGCLAEMYPDGKVGVDPVCVLGLNQNKGQKILLRLRTDDLQGFRKFLNIKKVLFHELTHNVHSEHDSKFYQLMRIVERECDELDWSNSGGRAVGGDGGIAIIPDEETTSGSSGQRLGGGGSSVSRLLRDTPAVGTCDHDHGSSHGALDSHMGSEPEGHSAVQPTELVEPVGTIEEAMVEPMEVDEPSPVEDANNKEVTTQEVPNASELTADPELPTQRAASPAPLFDVAFSGYEPSERELRMQRALEGLRARYAPDAASSAASLLHKILSNMVQHPTEDKYRSIRKSNRLFQTRLAGFPEGLEFLLAAGFEDRDESFVFARNDPALLWMGRSFLEVLLEDASEQNP